MEQPSINIAILGFGVVGSGTAEVLARSIARTNHRNQSHINLKYILVRKDLPQNPYYEKMVQDFSIIEADPSVQIVVESIGGVGVAYDLSKRALKAGKSVVTPNKELVATHGAELLALAKENNCNYLFESSVGGGIPILRPLTTCLLGNHITEVKGILNGTTNFILSKMFGENPTSYENALKEAQDLGYAEQDPTADVEGHDACRKIAILGNIAFGGVIDPHKIPTQGISGISDTDVAFARILGCKIKLLGRSFQTETGEIYAYVSPHFVPKDQGFFTVDNAFNMISVMGDSLGESQYYGQGAGPLPTASAVVGDVIDLSKDLHRFRENGWENNPLPLSDINAVAGRYFVSLSEAPETLAKRCAEKNLSNSISPELYSKEALCQGHSALMVENISKSALSTALDGLSVDSIYPAL